MLSLLVLFQMNPLKSPGPNGFFLPSFIRECQASQVALYSLSLSLFFTPGFLLQEFNSTFIALDSPQKKNSPKTPANLDIILFNRVFTYTGIFNRSKAIHGFT